MSAHLILHRIQGEHGTQCGRKTTDKHFLKRQPFGRLKDNLYTLEEDQVNNFSYRRAQHCYFSVTQDVKRGEYCSVGAPQLVKKLLYVCVRAGTSKEMLQPVYHQGPLHVTQVT